MKKHVIFLLVLFLLLLFFTFLTLLKGNNPFTFPQLLRILRLGRGDDFTILFQIRLPRVLGAIIVGGILSICGVVLQAILRNPLAEPYTLGISGGASLGAAIGIILGWGIGFRIVSGFAGSLFALGLVYALAYRRGFSVSSLILGGVVVSFLFTSLIWLFFSLSKRWEIHEMYAWIMGNLSSLSMNQVKLLSLLVIPASFILYGLGRDLNILLLGDEKATSLGVFPKKLRGFLFLLVSYLAGVCISFTGIIGFVGLIVPHLLRQKLGSQHIVLLPAAFLGGGLFLLLADFLARNIIYPQELPVGVITGILGGIFFLILFWSKKEWEIPR